MKEQEVHTSVMQRTIIRFFDNEGVQSSRILTRLQGQFGDDTLSKTHDKYIMVIIVCVTNKPVKKSVDPRSEWSSNSQLKQPLVKPGEIRTN